MSKRFFIRITLVSRRKKNGFGEVSDYVKITR